MMNYKEIKPIDLNESTFHRIGHDAWKFYRYRYEEKTLSWRRLSYFIYSWDRKNTIKRIIIEMK